MTTGATFPFPASPEEALATHAIGRTHWRTIFDPANYPGLEPDWTVDDLPTARELHQATDDTLCRWAFARRITLVRRHPTWLIGITETEFSAWEADARAIPLLHRTRLAGVLLLYNPPWAPLAELLYDRTTSAMARQGTAFARTLIAEFGARAHRAYFDAEFERFGRLHRRVNTETSPDLALDALLAEVRPRIRMIAEATP